MHGQYFLLWGYNLKLKRFIIFRYPVIGLENKIVDVKCWVNKKRSDSILQAWKVRAGRVIRWCDSVLETCLFDVIVGTMSAQHLRQIHSWSSESLVILKQEQRRPRWHETLIHHIFCEGERTQ